MAKIQKYMLILCFSILAVDGYCSTVFYDNFDGEPSTSILNYDSFVNWNVFNGTVDLLTSGDSFLVQCYGGAGQCVDLDGTTNDAALFVTKQSFDLPAGEYVLSFAISGNQRASGNDTVTVSLGSMFSETYTKTRNDPFELISVSINVPTATSANISFDHQGGDRYGIILDEVSLTAVPIPAAGWLFLSGILGIWNFAARSRKHKA